MGFSLKIMDPEILRTMIRGNVCQFGTRQGIENTLGGARPIGLWAPERFSWSKCLGYATSGV